jgi:hypothetical protein
MVACSPFLNGICRAALGVTAEGRLSLREDERTNAFVPRWP